MSFFIELIQYNRDILQVICQYLDDKSFRYLTITCAFLFSHRELKQLEDTYAELAIASRWRIKNIKVYDDRRLEILIKLYENRYNIISDIDITATTLINIKLPKNVTNLSISIPWRKVLNNRDFSFDKFNEMMNVYKQLTLIKINIYSVTKHSFIVDRQCPKRTYENDIKYWLVK